MFSSPLSLPRLTFNPDKFGGTKKYTVPADMIWVPDIGVHNR